jgi:hypothetical protein
MSRPIFFAKPYSVRLGQSLGDLRPFIFLVLADLRRLKMMLRSSPAFKASKPSSGVSTNWKRSRSLGDIAPQSASAFRLTMRFQYSRP